MKTSKGWHFLVNYPFKQKLKEIVIHNKPWEVSSNGTFWSNLFFFQLRRVDGNVSEMKAVSEVLIQSAFCSQAQYDGEQCS